MTPFTPKNLYLCIGRLFYIRVNGMDVSILDARGWRSFRIDLFIGFVTEV